MTLRPAERKIAMTKAKIIDAAFRAWGRTFYQKTSLSQVAKELDVSKPALYRYFLNKKALIEAMTEWFLDAFADSIRSDYEQAFKLNDSDEGISGIIQGVAVFYAKNVYAFIFRLINLHPSRDMSENSTRTGLKSRGLDMDALYQIHKNDYSMTDSGMLTHFIFTTLSFLMAKFHEAGKFSPNPPSESEIEKVSGDICRIIKQGIGFQAQEFDALNFEELEKRVEQTVNAVEPEPLLRAVAEAVAEAGPWAASMEMVAQRSGLSKSSLYGHFKNKKDMIRRLFMGEFKKIIDFARKGIGLSSIPAEQLYLGIFSVAVYLRSRPEILVVMGWIRTRKLDLGKSEKQDEVFRLFEDVDIEFMRQNKEDEKRKASHWIVFLLIATMMRQNFETNEQEKCFKIKGGNMQNSDIRLLYRFVILGLKGFKQ